MATSYEETFCVLEPCFVYRIPPRSSTQGYKAADWNLEQPVWQGRLSVKSKGDKCFIQLQDQQTGQIFAICNVNPENQSETVEPVLDSSRYYVLRIEDQQTNRHAFIGMGFHERDQSFELKASLQDFQRRIQNEKKLREAPITRGPKLNLTLKEGETIRVDIKSSGGSSILNNYEDEEDDGDLFLPPPPTANKNISSMSLKSKKTSKVSSPTHNTNTPKQNHLELLSNPVIGNSPIVSPQHSPSVTRSMPVSNSPLNPSSLNPKANFAPQQVPKSHQDLSKIPLNQLQPGQIPQPVKKKEPADPFANLVKF